MSRIYMGLENELTSFKKMSRTWHQESCYEALVKPPGSFDCSVEFNDFALTADGIGFYEDGAEIEINTPPVLINKGFASRVIDLVLRGRDVVLDYTRKGRVHTGYSIHWNVSRVCDANWDNDDRFYVPFSPVFSLLGTTPLSIGAGNRANVDRHQLIGDSLNNEPQLRSLAILLGAYALAVKTDASVFGTAYPRRQFVKDRSDVVQLSDSAISAQEYLERMHRSLSPIIKQITSSAEREELSRIVSGSLPIEGDKEEAYKRYALRDGKDFDVYIPTLDPLLPSVVIKPSQRSSQPLEGRLWGALAKEHLASVEQQKTRGFFLLDDSAWDQLSYAHTSFGNFVEGEIYFSGLCSETKSIQEIYAKAARLSKGLRAPVPLRSIRKPQVFA